MRVLHMKIIYQTFSTSRHYKQNFKKKKTIFKNFQNLIFTQYWIYENFPKKQCLNLMQEIIRRGNSNSLRNANKGKSSLIHLKNQV